MVCGSIPCCNYGTVPMDHLVGISSSTTCLDAVWYGHTRYASDSNLPPLSFKQSSEEGTMVTLASKYLLLVRLPSFGPRTRTFPTEWKLNINIRSGIIYAHQFVQIRKNLSKFRVPQPAKLAVYKPRRHSSVLDRSKKYALAFHQSACHCKRFTFTFHLFPFTFFRVSTFN